VDNLASELQCIERRAGVGLTNRARQGAADRGDCREAGGVIAGGLIAALQFCGRIPVGIHNALNRVIAGRTSKNL